MGFYEDDDGINSQFTQRRIDGTDILSPRGTNWDELDKSIQRFMNEEPPIKLQEDL